MYMKPAKRAENVLITKKKMQWCDVMQVLDNTPWYSYCNICVSSQHIDIYTWYIHLIYTSVYIQVDIKLHLINISYTVYIIKFGGKKKKIQVAIRLFNINGEQDNGEAPLFRTQRREIMGKLCYTQPNIKYSSGIKAIIKLI